MQLQNHDINHHQAAGGGARDVVTAAAQRHRGRRAVMTSSFTGEHPSSTGTSEADDGHVTAASSRAEVTERLHEACCITSDPQRPGVTAYTAWVLMGAAGC